MRLKSIKNIDKQIINDTEIIKREVFLSIFDMIELNVENTKEKAEKLSKRINKKISDYQSYQNEVESLISDIEYLLKESKK